MAPQMSNLSVAAQDLVEQLMSSFIDRGLVSGHMVLEECDPIGDSEFKMLMAFVVIATVAFGCIVNGWIV